MLKYGTEKAPSILVLSKSWFLWKCLFFVFWMGRCSPSMSCNFFSNIFLFSNSAYYERSDSHVSSPFFHSLNSQNWLQEVQMNIWWSKRFWWDSGEILVGDVGGEIYDGPAWMGWHFFSIVVLYSNSTVLKRSDAHVFSSFIHPLNSQNWLQEVRKETGGSNRGASPLLEGGFWSKMAQNPMSTCFWGEPPSLEMCKYGQTLEKRASYTSRI